MAAIAESTLQMALELPIAACSRCHATVSAAWTRPSSSLYTAAVLPQRHILPACVIHAEVSKLVHSSPSLLVSSACTKWPFILADRHAKPSAFMHGKRTEPCKGRWLSDSTLWF